MATQVISSTVAPRVPIMCGSATFTMLESSTAMNVPVSTVPATTHLCGAWLLTACPQASAGCTLT